MSPRAACRLETMGFMDVYDYVAGKLDWMAAGLPVEGSMSDLPRVGDAARTDTPTCGLEDLVGAIHARISADRWNQCVVTADGGVVLGRLRGSAWDRPEARAEEVMEPGPITVRAHVPLQAEVERMDRRGTRSVIVTNPEGVLMGILRRADAEKLLAEGAVEEVWDECPGCRGQWQPRVTAA